jgi:hypothetical protein
MTAPADTAPPPLRLIAVDREDLEILSTSMQDAIVRVADMTFIPAQKRFALLACRFDWLAAAEGRAERARAGLHFDYVTKATRSGFDQQNGDAVLNLLGIVFEETQAPGGTVELVFSANAAIRLEVECIDAQLRDLGDRWQARATPGHPGCGGDD